MCIFGIFFRITLIKIASRYIFRPLRFSNVFKNSLCFLSIYLRFSSLQMRSRLIINIDNKAGPCRGGTWQAIPVGACFTASDIHHSADGRTCLSRRPEGGSGHKTNAVCRPLRVVCRATPTTSSADEPGADRCLVAWMPALTTSCSCSPLSRSSVQTPREMNQIN